MEEVERSKIQVISVAPSAARVAELEEALRSNLEQLQRWLNEQELRELQQLAEVETLFQESAEHGSGPRSSPRLEDEAADKDPSSVLPGVPNISDGDTRLDDMDMLHDFGDVGEEAQRPVNDLSGEEVCKMQADCLESWNTRQSVRWSKARSRLQRQLQKGVGQGRRNSNTELETKLESERPKISQYIPQEDEGSILRRVFLLFETSEKYAVGTVISAIMVTTILISTVAFVLESMPELQQRSERCEQLRAAGEPLTVEACEPVPMEFFAPIEAVCIAIFTTEYLIRICTSCTEPKYGTDGCRRVLRYASTTLNLIDLAAIVPFYLGVILGSEAVGAVRILRLMRVLRLLKLAKHHPGITLCVEAMVESGVPLAILMFFNIIFGVIFASVIFYFEGSDFSVDSQFLQNGFPRGAFVRKDAVGKDILTPFRSIPISLWWVFTTTTTVGYGDMAPTSHVGRAIGVLCFYTGIIFLALPIGVLSSNFETAYARHLERKRKYAPKLLEVAEQHLLPGTSTKRVSMFYQLTGTETDGFRRSLFKVLSDPSSSEIAKWASYFITAVILVTTVNMLLESMPELSQIPDACSSSVTVENCRPKPLAVFFQIELVCIIIFTVDYVLRLCTAHAMSPRELGVQYVGEKTVPAWKATLRYATQWLNLVDLFAIVPFYVELAGLKLGSSAVIRVIRLIRVFRLLKSPKMRNCVDMIIDIVKDSLPGILSVFSLTVLVCVLFASCIYFAEGTEYSVDHFQAEYPYGVYVRPSKSGYDMEISPFRSILHSFWWFFTTATTVGYGDEFPTTTAGRLVAICTFYAGVVLVAIMLTIVGGAFSAHYPRWVKSDKAKKSKTFRGSTRIPTSG